MQQLLLVRKLELMQRIKHLLPEPTTCSWTHQVSRSSFCSCCGCSPAERSSSRTASPRSDKPAVEKHKHLLETERLCGAARCLFYTSQQPDLKQSSGRQFIFSTVARCFFMRECCVSKLSYSPALTKNYIFLI